jgi:hypothetical protein
MADETTTSWTDLLREAKGPLVEALKYKTVLLSELKRDKSARRWHGKQITIPIFLAPEQGAGSISETGASAVLNLPSTVQTEQAVIYSGIVAQAVSFTTQILQQAAGDENSWAEVLPTKMQRAEDAFGRTINEMMMGNSSGTNNGLLAAVTGATGASGGASQAIAVGTSANFYQLYPGRFVDVRVRSSGAFTTGATARVKIIAYDDVAGTVTVQYEDGSNTSFATATTDGLYITGSYGTSIQGFGAAVATTGTFETINKANVWAWQGTDATPGAPTDPSIAVFDTAERKTYQKSGRLPQFYLADPAVVDKYTQGLTVQARWAGEAGQLESGWTGVRYRNKLIIPDFDMPSNTAYGPQLEDMAIYTLDDGPDWDDHTGSVFQRFSQRTLPLEAWMVWMLQVGYQACNALVKIGNLNKAT